MDEKKRIEEMARCCTYYHEGECLADATHPEKCDLMCEMFGVFANLEKEDYRKQSEGEWLIIEYEFLTCSECGFYHWSGCDSTAEAKERLAEGKYPNYCSDCGAHMKGESK